MDCPYCSSTYGTRSSRHGVRDFLGRQLGLFPWHCGTCSKRFYQRKRYPGGQLSHPQPGRWGERGVVRNAGARIMKVFF